MRGTDSSGAKPAARRLVRVLAGRRRRAALLFLALAYAAAMLVLAICGGEALGSGGMVEAALRRRQPPALPGSVYRSHLMFERLLPEMRAFTTHPNPVSTQFWFRLRKGKFWFLAWFYVYSIRIANLQ
jgi:hypothetical protein